MLTWKWKSKLYFKLTVIFMSCGFQIDVQEKYVCQKYFRKFESMKDVALFKASKIYLSQEIRKTLKVL